MRECPSGNGCCTAAVHCFLLAARHGDGIRQYDRYQDMRTHGQNEQLLTESRERRSVYLKFADELIQALKLPVGRDGFFGEIHPKLRPVGTAVEGVTIADACQARRRPNPRPPGLPRPLATSDSYRCRRARAHLRLLAVGSVHEAASQPALIARSRLA